MGKLRSRAKWISRNSISSRSGLVERIRATLPELPRARAARYQGELGLSPQDAGVLVGGYTVGENTRAFIAMRVPEPGTWMLAGVALLALGVSRRRKALAA